MNIRDILIASAALALNLASGAAQAALIDRGGGLIYDTVLDITWLQDANHAKTSGYAADGRMSWEEATNWADRFAYYDSVRDKLYDDWRLPSTTDFSLRGCDLANSASDCGYNVATNSSEMAHLYFTDLGNQSYLTPTGVINPAFAGGSNPTSTLDNVGIFINLQSGNYWSDTHYLPGLAFAWYFGTATGVQYFANTNNENYSMLVRSGDVAGAIAPVPEPQTWAMLLAGLGLIGTMASRRRS